MPRRMTVKGFLLAECNRLLGLEKPTSSLAKLYRASSGRGGARAREYVFLLAIERSQLERLEKLVDEGIDRRKKQHAYLEVEGFSLEDLFAMAVPYEGDARGFLETHGDALGKRFSQVLDLLRAPQARRENDAHVKSLMRAKIAMLLSKAGRTPYSMIVDLGLNAGNVYAYLRGDDAKVSRATARRMLEYAEALAK